MTGGKACYGGVCVVVAVMVVVMCVCVCVCVCVGGGGVLPAGDCRLFIYLVVGSSAPWMHARLVSVLAQPCCGPVDFHRDVL